MTAGEPTHEQAGEAEELSALRQHVEMLSHHLVQMVEVVELLSDRQNSTTEELRAYTSTVPTWRDHVMDDEKRVSEQLGQIIANQGVLGARLDFLTARADAHAALERDRRYDIEGMAAQLAEVRASAEYAAALAEENPLITIRIATFDRPVELVERAIKSVLAQTYTNWELIVASDGPSRKNRAAVESVRDPRVRYIELPERSSLPVNPRNRYQVGGAAPFNFSNGFARGTWIAQLDDDDEYTADHFEKLLAVARGSQAEFVYGALIQRNLVTGQDALIWSDPPQYGGISLQGAMWLRCLPFMDFDEGNWLVDEPADWGLVRRIMAAGVRHASTTDVIGTLYMVPYTHK
jgi:hypothetical protein